MILIIDSLCFIRQKPVIACDFFTGTRFIKSEE